MSISPTVATFGNASDGDVTISTDTTLTQDMNYNNLVINSGVTLYPDGYVIYVNKTLTLSGIISRNGNDGDNAWTWVWGGAGGTALSTRSVGGSGAGGTGAGIALAATDICYPGHSAVNIANGIAGSSGGTPAPSSGTFCGHNSGDGGITTTTHTVTDIDDIIINASLRMGGPGGGGAASCVYRDQWTEYKSGGGGGSGGGVILISVLVITGDGSINAKGGAGGHPTGCCCSVPIAGGGGGGAVVIEYNDKDDYTGTVNVAGGTGSSSGTAGTITYIFSYVAPSSTPTETPVTHVPYDPPPTPIPPTRPPELTIIEEFITFLSTPLNWLLLLFAYLGALFARIIDPEGDGVEETNLLLINVLFFGTIGWIIILLINFAGFTIITGNEIFNIIIFLIGGFIFTLIPALRPPAKKPNKAKKTRRKSK